MKIGTQTYQADTSTPIKRHRGDFLRFVNDFRRQMRADVEHGIYPEVEFEGKKYGVNFSGLLYDKSTTNIISTVEAKRIYRFLYENKQESV